MHGHRYRWSRTLAASLSAFSLWIAASTPARASEPALPREPALQAQRLMAGEVLPLDGSLDHPAWTRAQPFSGFVVKEPRAGEKSPYDTTVRILFDDQALYFGVQALDPDIATVRAPIVRHDNVLRTQDFLAIYIDTAGTRRSAQFFRTNASGSLGDGIYNAGYDTEVDNEDFSPDFDFDVATRYTSEGYTAVFRIPFASLRYDSGPTSGWRVMVTRRVPRDQSWLLTSAAIPPEAAHFLVSLQPLQGIELPADSWFMAVRPSVVAHSSRDDSNGRKTTDHGIEVGLDVKLRSRPELLIDATFNPDFSQVELDVPQLAGNTRFALSLQEKRAFFLESNDLLRSPSEALQTRSITQPRWGLRGTWRAQGTAATGFLVKDEGRGVVLIPSAYDTGIAEQPASTTLVLRGQAEAGATSSVQWGGLVGAKRYADGRGDNLVAGPDVLWSLGDAVQVRGQWLHSQTSAYLDAEGELSRGRSQGGQRVRLLGVGQSENTQTELTIDQISSGFRNDTGFVPQSGVRIVDGRQGYGWRDLDWANEFWANLWFADVHDLANGLTVRRYVTPGFTMAGPYDLLWTLQYRGPIQHVRPSATAPLLNERYWYSELDVSPARWMPNLYLELSFGDQADMRVNQVRHGASAVWGTKLRALDRLEIEPTLSFASLRGEGATVYRESAFNLLGIWHFDAQQSLRAIWQQTDYDRRQEGGFDAERKSGRLLSLTYVWRHSASTVLYVGATRSTGDDGNAERRGAEAFIKLQTDFSELF